MAGMGVLAARTDVVILLGRVTESIVFVDWLRELGTRVKVPRGNNNAAVGVEDADGGGKKIEVDLMVTLSLSKAAVIVSAGISRQSALSAYVRSQPLTKTSTLMHRRDHRQACLSAFLAHWNK